MTHLRWVSLLGALLTFTSCASFKSAFGGGVDLQAKGLSAEAPSNVSVYLVAQAGDQPLATLDESAFRIYEDGRMLDATESRPALLDRTLVADYRTLLLLDLSGALNEGAERDAIARAAATFLAKVTESQAVTVYAFAGEPQPTLVGDYAPGQAGTAADLESKLKTFAVRDSSRDLGSAVVEGNRELDARLVQSQKPFRVGTLVVFAKGPDLARRVSDQAQWDAQSRSPHQLVAIGIGEADYLKRWGRSGFFTLKPTEDPATAFQQAAARVVDLEKSHYLLSYCSPARAGRRVLRVEVVSTSQDGSMKKGSIQEEFEANGFGPGCDPKRPPRFMPGAAPPAAPPTTTPPPQGAPPSAATAPPPGTEGVPPPIAPPTPSGTAVAPTDNRAAVPPASAP